MGVHGAAELLGGILGVRVGRLGQARSGRGLAGGVGIHQERQDGGIIGRAAELDLPGLLQPPVERQDAPDQGLLSSRQGAHIGQGKAAPFGRQDAQYLVPLQ